MQAKLNEVIELLMQIEEDNTLPKNIRVKIRSTIVDLRDEEKVPAIRANKAIEELESVSDDGNTPTYTRTLIWNVVSLLESIQ